MNKSHSNTSAFLVYPQTFVQFPPTPAFRTIYAFAQHSTHNNLELWSNVVFGVRQGFEGGGGLAENVACLE